MLKQVGHKPQATLTSKTSPPHNHSLPFHPLKSQGPFPNSLSYPEWVAVETQHNSNDLGNKTVNLVLQLLKFHFYTNYL